VPKVTWSVVSNVPGGLVGNISCNGKQLVGHVDNSLWPATNVDIRMTLVTPASAKGPVPVLMMFGGFGGGGMPRPAGTPAPTNRPEFGGPFKDPPSTEQLLAAGWGYATINPGSIQADNGAGLTKGIIGLCNKGQPRKPDDWGSLRAWAWGAARGLDYLEVDLAVDAKKVGIEGVSRFGKAALVTMAFEPRFAVVMVGSSGEGGAKLHRRNFGEAVENLTGSGRIPLDGRQFFEIRRGRVEIRHQERGRFASRRAYVDRFVRAKADVHQLRHPGTRRRQLARPAGKLHGYGRGGTGVPVARRARHRRERGLSNREDATGKYRSARWGTGLASARWRTRGPLQHEIFYSLGGKNAGSKAGGEVDLRSIPQHELRSH